MKSISLIVLSVVVISTALPQFNQGSNQGLPNQQQGFPNIFRNQNPFLPGNQGFGVIEEFPNQGFGGQQTAFGGQPQQTGFGNQQPGVGDQAFGNKQQTTGFGGQQMVFGGQQGLNNNNQQGSGQNQQQSTTAVPGASTSVVGSRQFILCNQNCPSVNQYNPICGTDQVTYNNQYRLDCANDCGRQLDPNWQEITIFSRRNCVSGSRVA